MNIFDANHLCFQIWSYFYMNELLILRNVHSSWRARLNMLPQHGGENKCITSSSISYFSFMRSVMYRNIILQVEQFEPFVKAAKSNLLSSIFDKVLFHNYQTDFISIALETCHNLEILKLHNCILWSVQCLKPYHAKLAQFELRNSYLTIPHLQFDFLASKPNLKHFVATPNFDSWYSLVPIDTDLLCYPQLEYLEGACFTTQRSGTVNTSNIKTMIFDSAVHEFDSRFNQTFHPHLTSLSLTINSFISVICRAFTQIQKFPNLVYLQLQFLKGDYDEITIPLECVLPNLETISLKNYSLQIPVVDFLNIFQCNNTLSSLRIEFEKGKEFLVDREHLKANYPNLVNYSESIYII